MSDLKEYVSLKEFAGGERWYIKVRANALKYIKIFEKLSRDNLREAVETIGGQVVDKKFYENVAWSFTVHPLPYLEILMLLTLDSEFGNDFFVYYSKSALKQVPTEDVIVYSWVYLALLAKEGYNILYGKAMEFEKHPMATAILGERLKVFKHIDTPTARKVAKIIRGQSIENHDAKWMIEVEPIPNFKIKYLLKDGKGEIYYDRDEVRKFGYLHEFLWLYCNAIIRESRKILKDKIPPLSASGIL